jgi:hypothetical protein
MRLIAGIKSVVSATLTVLIPYTYQSVGVSTHLYIVCSAWLSMTDRSAAYSLETQRALLQYVFFVTPRQQKRSFQYSLSTKTDSPLMDIHIDTFHGVVSVTSSLWRWRVIWPTCTYRCIRVIVCAFSLAATVLRARWFGDHYAFLFSVGGPYRKMQMTAYNLRLSSSSPPPPWGLR